MTRTGAVTRAIRAAESKRYDPTRLAAYRIQCPPALKSSGAEVKADSRMIPAGVGGLAPAGGSSDPAAGSPSPAAGPAVARRVATAAPIDRPHTTIRATSTPGRSRR